MEEQVQSQESLSATGQDLGFWGRLGNIFGNPRRTFEAINIRPTWLVPVIAVLVLMLLSAQLTFPMMINYQLERLRENPNIGAEQMRIIEQQVTQNANQQRVFALIGQIIFILIVFLLLSGIFYFVGSVILGGDATFKKVLAVAAWSSFIFLIGLAVKTILILLKGSMNITLSPALLLSADSVGTRLYTFLSQFDIFTIWFLAVFALGFAIIYKFSLTRAYIAVGILWGIWIAAATVFSNVLNRFGV
jgi:hypothetical protein